MTIDTACSSSLIGLHLGARSLKTGGSNMVSAREYSVFKRGSNSTVLVVGYHHRDVITF